MRDAGAEGIEMVMWLIMRGALGDKADEVYRFYTVPASNTAVGHIILEPRKGGQSPPSRQRGAPPRRRLPSARRRPKSKTRRAAARAKVERLRS